MKNKSKKLFLLTLTIFIVLQTVIGINVSASEEIASISIEFTKSYYKVGDSTAGTGQVQVVAKKADGTPVSMNPGDFTYSFSNPEALTVSNQGVITAVAAGGGILTVSYGDLSAKMYLGAYTGIAQVDSGEGDYPPLSDSVVKTTISRTGLYGIQLKNGGRWPKYNDNYDSAVSEIWFYDDGVSEDTFFAYFQSTGNDTYYTPRKDGPSTAQYFVGFNKAVSGGYYYYNSYAGQRSLALTGWNDTNMGVTQTVTSVPRSAGWHQVTCVVEAGYEAFDKTGTIELYLDGTMIFTENYTHRFMGVLRPEGQGEHGGIFDDLIYYTNGNNIPQTAPEAKNLSIEGYPEEQFTLTAHYEYYDRNGDYEKPVSGTGESSSPIEWQVSDNGTDGWSTLSAAAQQNDTLQLTENERGKYVRFVVTPTSSDQNYAVANTARTGIPTPSEAVQVAAAPTNWEEMKLSHNTTWCPRNGTKQLTVLGKKGNEWITLNGHSGITFISSDSSIAAVSDDGTVTGEMPGVCNITVSFDGTALSDRLMVIVGTQAPLSQGFESESTEQARSGYRSLKLTGTQLRDFYGQSFARNGVLEGWFYDDGTGGDREVYFQSGARGNTIPVTAMYSVGIRQAVSTTKYYVRSVKSGRVEAGGAGGTDEFATNIDRSPGWHQVVLAYQFGLEVDDNLGKVTIYLDGTEVFTENYSHENMQVIRGRVTEDETGAFFDDFSFYDFDNEPGPDLGEGTERVISALTNEIVDLEYHVTWETALNTTYTLSFLTSDFEIYDLCGLTFERELQAGVTAGGVTVQSISEGIGGVTKITFQTSKLGDMFVKKTANIIRLKAKRPGTFTVLFTVQR